MSGVVKRKRKLSNLEFYKKALDIREILTRYVMNEKNIPKRYRFVFTMPIIHSLHKLFHNIINANSIYPYNEKELEMRKEYQRQVLTEISYLLHMLDYILSVLPQNKSKIANIVTLLYEEYNLIQGWRKSSKIYKRNNDENEIINQENIDINEIINVINEHIQNIDNSTENKEIDKENKLVITTIFDD